LYANKAEPAWLHALSGSVGIKGNTVHLTISTRKESSLRATFLARLRVGNLLTFRLTARGLLRPRLELTRPSAISSRMASWSIGLR
jgi:hypothetical protein